jgi:hypothetical protein
MHCSLRSKSHWTRGRAEAVPSVTPKLTPDDIASQHLTVAERDAGPVRCRTCTARGPAPRRPMFLFSGSYVPWVVKLSEALDSLIEDSRTRSPAREVIQ